VQELEAEVQSLQKENQQLLQQIDSKDAELSALQNELTTWKSIRDVETQNLSKTANQLTEQLSQQIVKSKTIQAQLAKTQSEWVRGQKLSS
jgi:predicted RNase H-like nuclease (RuvC/YqgF family)